MLRLVEPPAAAESWGQDDVITLRSMDPPSIDTPEKAFEWGHIHGRIGVDLYTGDLPLDLVDHAREGWQLGQQERDQRAIAAEPTILETTPYFEEGVAHWAVLPTPEELAEKMRSKIADIQGDDFGATFCRRLIEWAAGDVYLFRCQTWAHYDGRMNMQSATWGKD